MAALSRAPGAAEYAGSGDGRGLHGQPAGAAGQRAARSSSPWSSTWSRRSRAPTSPGLIAISAGYDAHRDDPLASCAVDTAAYGEMTATMRELGAELDVPVLVCLEGGYAPSALADSVVATLRRSTATAPPRTRSPRPRRAAPAPAARRARRLLG